MNENNINVEASNEVNNNSNNNKKKSIIVIVMFALIMGCSMYGLASFVNSTYKLEEDYEDDEVVEEVSRNYIIHYNSGYSIYDIKVNDNKLNVVVYNEIQCIQAPCDPIEVDRYSLKYKSEYKNMFDRLYDIYKKEEYTIYNNDLNDKDIILLKEIFRNEDIDFSSNDRVEVTNYEIEEDLYSDEKEAGYKVNGKEVSICMGEKNTGGYSIDVNKVYREGSNLFIYITENSPKHDDIVTDALTYPCVYLKFEFMVNDVILYSGGH